MKYRSDVLRLVRTVLPALILTTAVSAGPYENVVNEPFATVSNGPQNAAVLDVSDPVDRDSYLRSLDTALTRTKTTRAQTRSRYSRQLEFLKKAGLIDPGEPASVDGIVMFRYNGELLYPPQTKVNTPGRMRVSNEPAATRAYGVGDITFVYDTAWNSISYSDELDANVTAMDVLKQVQALAVPLLDQVYGKPSNTFVLYVTLDDTISDRDAFAGGLYLLSSPERVIKLPKYSSARSLARSYLHLIVHAYHDSAKFDYDAWEEGFARAASVVVGDMIDRSPNRPSWFPPIDYMGSRTSTGNDAFYYLMSYYELFNQPALGNNTFLTTWTEQITDGMMGFGGMLIPRMGMSSTAWLKVYTERLIKDGQSFFKLFNEQYYDQLNTNPGLRGNIPLLKNIAASITPTVEGKSFNEWYSRQHVLNTSVSTGAKLYAYIQPIVPENPDEKGYSFYSFLINYTTTETGDELPLNGRCFPVYWNYDYSIDLFLGRQYEESTIINGEGYTYPTFFTANLGGAQRVTIDNEVNGASQRVYVPVGFTGTITFPNTVYGVVIGGNSGSVTVQSNTGQETSQVVNGGFGTRIDPGVNLLRQITLTYTSGSNTVTKTVNIGPGSYIGVIEATPQVKTLTRSFPAGYSFMSIPLTPLETDHALALGGNAAVPPIDPANLQIAYWDFDKYLMYPKLPPFKAGKGYWLRFSVPTTVKVTGEVTNTSVDYRIPLVYGWNQVGCPFETSVPLSNLWVEYGNLDPFPFEDAWIYGIISQTVYKYNGESYSYATSLEPWQGYWFYCRAPEGAVLIVPH